MRVAPLRARLSVLLVESRFSCLTIHSSMNLLAKGLSEDLDPIRERDPEIDPIGSYV